MLKVLINCPGGWSHGLDSPERGEGRWAQNVTRCLARSGLYDVSACSGGIPTWGRGIVEPNVALLSEQDAARSGPYDLYFDASWWNGKPAAAEARYNFHVHFGFEPRLGIPMPDGHYLVYVLKWSVPFYFGEACGNSDRTFFLPAPFNSEMLRPDPSRRKIIHTMRGSDAPGRVGYFEKLYSAVSRLRETEHIPFTWLRSEGIEEPRHVLDHVLATDSAWGIPYCDIRTQFRDCGLNSALDGWSNILDATALGVPSLAWEGGAYKVILEIAMARDLVIEQGANVDRVTDVIRRLYSDPALYIDYTRDFQAAFADHTDAVTLAQFHDIVHRVTL